MCTNWQAAHLVPWHGVVKARNQISKMQHYAGVQSVSRPLALLTSTQCWVAALPANLAPLLVLLLPEQTAQSLAALHAHARDVVLNNGTATSMLWNATDKIRKLTCPAVRGGSQQLQPESAGKPLTTLHHVMLLYHALPAVHLLLSAGGNPVRGRGICVLLLPMAHPQSAAVLSCHCPLPLPLVLLLSLTLLRQVI